MKITPDEMLRIRDAIMQAQSEGQAIENLEKILAEMGFSRIPRLVHG